MPRGTPGTSPGLDFFPGPAGRADALKVPFCSASGLAGGTTEGTTRALCSASLNAAPNPFPARPGACWEHNFIPSQFPPHPIPTPRHQLTQCEYDGEMAGGWGGPGSQPRPQPRRLLLEPPYARRRRPATSSRQPSPSLRSLRRPLQPRGPRQGEGRAGNVRAGTATGRPSSRAQDPGGSESQTHTHTRARAPANPFARGSRKALSQLFIHSPKARLPSPGRLHPAIPGGSETAHCATRALRPHAQPDAPALPARSPASPPHTGRSLPGSPPPAPRRSDLPRSARRAQPAGAAAAEKRRQRPSPAASGAGRGQGAEGREEGGGGGEQKFRQLGARPRPRLLPRPPPRCPLREPGLAGVGAWGTPPSIHTHPPRPPASSAQIARGTGAGGGCQPESGRERRIPTYLPRAAPGNFPEVRGGAEHLAGEFPPPPLTTTAPTTHPTRAHTVTAPVCLWVCPPPAAHSRLLGPLFRAAGPSVPRGVRPRRPPGVRSATTPSPRPLSPGSGCILSRHGGDSPSRGVPGARGARRRPGPAAKGRPR